MLPHLSAVCTFLRASGIFSPPMIGCSVEGTLTSILREERVGETHLRTSHRYKYGIDPTAPLLYHQETHS